jgi:hypothetical protein
MDLVLYGKQMNLWEAGVNFFRWFIGSGGVQMMGKGGIINGTG